MSKFNDIFVSYAHVDNIATNSAPCGWVDYFLRDLKVELNQQFGRQEDYIIWKDEALRGNKPLTNDILKQLRQSRVLLVFHSKGYQRSKWCQRELDTFTQATGVSTGRIFFIEQDKTSHSKIYQDLLGYRFWEERKSGGTYRLASLEPDRPERDYRLRIGDVAEQLYEKIIGLRAELKQTQTNAQTIIIPQNKKILYVAQVSDSLISAREALVRELKQHGYEVIPQNHKPDDVFTLESHMQAVLKDCLCFVQLLDEYDSMGIPIRLQAVAQQANSKIFQWRRRELQVESVKNELHRQLLLEHTVMASSLVEFQQHLLKKIQPQTIKQSKPSQQKSIFINTSPDDFPLAVRLYDKLVKEDYNCLLPIENTQASAAEIRKDLEDNLKLCDVTLIIYRNSPMAYVRNLLKDCLRISSRENKSFKTAICLLPNKPSLRMHIKNMHELYCDENFDSNCLEKLMKEVVS